MSHNRKRNRVRSAPRRPYSPGFRPFTPEAEASTAVLGRPRNPSHTTSTSVRPPVTLSRPTRLAEHTDGNQTASFYDSNPQYTPHRPYSPGLRPFPPESEAFTAVLGQPRNPSDTTSTSVRPPVTLSRPTLATEHTVNSQAASTYDATPQSTPRRPYSPGFRPFPPEADAFTADIGRPRNASDTSSTSVRPPVPLSRPTRLTESTDSSQAVPTYDSTPQTTFFYYTPESAEEEAARHEANRKKKDRENISRKLKSLIDLQDSLASDEQLKALLSRRAPSTSAHITPAQNVQNFNSVSRIDDHQQLDQTEHEFAVNRRQSETRIPALHSPVLANSVLPSFNASYDDFERPDRATEH
ncbi:hypothetical protein CVT26_006144, partial [Gymnopilus dilepis]